ncbi:DUF1236 domain-containing protein [Chelativorans composti]|jgi:Protein of unknown function (DUF1236).|uniref:DUF1236 domain-containing protein n=1 Tax=Chelativorans composti TaxID=768533 RepID=A0ABW5DHT9_9HYPH|nr:DUF1236 domain-containing protein [bacterium SGD-2]
MRRILLTAAAAAFAGTAMAQTVVITPEQETVIREYVVTHQPQPVEMPPELTLEVGTPLPEAIELQPLDAPDLGVQYRYFVVDGRTVLVEPQTREIVYILE